MILPALRSPSWARQAMGEPAGWRMPSAQVLGSSVPHGTFRPSPRGVRRPYDRLSTMACLSSWMAFVISIP